MISFQKNLQHIKEVWKDVLDEKSTTNWSLFEYEGQTNELKVAATGSGGLEELSEELNSGKIMYAFVKVEDANTALSKILLINWQGEGVPVLRKGMCANHIHDVGRILPGAHLTISARNEDDIELERLLKQLSSVVTAGYRMKKQPTETGVEEKQIIGTNYKRVIPTKELNPSAMQDFWRKEEEEEKNRIEAESATKKKQTLKLEQEQRAREEKEHLAREKQLTSLNKLQSSHVPIKTTPQPLDQNVSCFVENTNGGMTKAEEMRQMRNKEARDLIGSRVGAAKAAFTQNTSQIQLQEKLNAAPPLKPVRSSISQRIIAFDSGLVEQQPAPKCLDTMSAEEDVPNRPELTLQKKDIAFHEIEATAATEIAGLAIGDELQFNEAHTSLDIDDHYSTIKRSPYSKSNSLQSPDIPSSSNATNMGLCEDVQGESEEVLRTKVSVTVQQSQSVKNGGTANNIEKNLLSDIVNEDDLICEDGLGELGLKARALYDYQAADESEITFDPGDVITHIDQIDDGWWQGLAPDGTYGLFPANYVEIIN